MNIAVFASHGGSDLQAIIDGCKSNKIGANVSVVISNNGSSMALQRAKNEGIPSYHLSAKKFGSEELLAEKILEVLSKYQIDMIFLAGYMRMLHISILEKYNNRIFNIHPALLPKFGGKGMYGDNVHKAVVENKETESGITIHFLNERFDEGEHIAQYKCEVLPTDSPDDVATKVHALEYEWYPKVIEKVL